MSINFTFILKDFWIFQCINSQLLCGSSTFIFFIVCICGTSLQLKNKKAYDLP